MSPGCRSTEVLAQFPETRDERRAPRVVSCECSRLHVLSDILSHNSLALPGKYEIRVAVHIFVNIYIYFCVAYIVLYICKCTMACIVVQFFCISLFRRALYRHNPLHSAGPLRSSKSRCKSRVLLFQLTSFARSSFASNYQAQSLWTHAAAR